MSDNAFSAAIAAMKSGTSMSPDAAASTEVQTTSTGDAGRTSESVDNFETDDEANLDLHDSESYFDEPAAIEVTDESDETTAEIAAVETDTESFKIKDSDQKLVVDYKDRAKIKKAYVEAAGMRKFQLERDNVRKELATLNSSGMSEKAALADTLSSSWESKGIAGLVETLTKGKQSFDDLVQIEIDRREQYSLMSPVEQAREDSKRAIQEAQQAASNERSRVDEIEKRIAVKEEAAEIASLQSDMNTPFNQFRFAGKLGDPIKEHELDTMLWEATRATLMRLPADTVLTPQLINREFKRRSQVLQGHIKKSATEGATAILKQKGREAKEQAQSQMASSTKENSSDRELREGIAKGDFMGAFKRAMTRGR